MLRRERLDGKHVEQLRVVAGEHVDHPRGFGSSPAVDHRAVRG